MIPEAAVEAAAQVLEDVPSYDHAAPDVILTVLEAPLPHIQARSSLPDEYVGADKRLTDAELAAEFHRAVSSFQTSSDMSDLSCHPNSWFNEDRDRGWMYAMERFATRPHASENDYE